MYCIHCGNPIPENSKFCSQCGKEQIISKVETKTEVVTQEVTPNNTLSSFKNTISRTALIWYCIWVVLHLGLLLIGSDGIFDSSNMDGIDDFFPFNHKSRVKVYDITEFLVYTLFPLLIMFIAYLVNQQMIPLKLEVCILLMKIYMKKEVAIQNISTLL